MYSRQPRANGSRRVADAEEHAARLVESRLLTGMRCFNSTAASQRLAECLFDLSPQRDSLSRG
jgi:hypothetical protein